MPSADSTPLPSSGRDPAWDPANKPVPPAKTNGTRPILELAAQSIADAGGASGTVVDVIHGRAFRHYAEGLRQYLTVRLGSPEEATAVLRELRGASAAKGAAALVKLPGIRPRLFRMARELAERRLKQPFKPPPSGGTLQWRLSEDDQGVQQLRDRLFDSLSGEAWEAAELHHGRGLPPEEVAFVLDEPEAAVHGYLAEAASRAKEVVPASDAEPDSLSDLFFSAFSVEQPAMETADPPARRKRKRRAFRKGKCSESATRSKPRWAAAPSRTCIARKTRKCLAIRLPSSCSTNLRCRRRQRPWLCGSCGSSPPCSIHRSSNSKTTAGSKVACGL